MNNITKELFFETIMNDNLHNNMMVAPELFSFIVPEFEKCIGFEQNNPYHKYDVYKHIAESLRHAILLKSDFITRAALFFHDIGKPECFTLDERKIGHFYGHHRVSMKIAENTLERFGFEKEIIDKVCELIYYHDKTISENKNSVKKFLNKLGKEQLLRLIDVKYCDTKAHHDLISINNINYISNIYDLINEILFEELKEKENKLVINGDDIIALGFSEGKLIGHILMNIKNNIEIGSLRNTKEDILYYINTHDWY